MLQLRCLQRGRRLLPLLLAAFAFGSILPAEPQGGPNCPPARLPAPPVFLQPTQPPLAPAAPERYDVVIRYRIDAPRDERLRRYFRLVEDLTAAGFVRSPADVPSQIEPEDARHTRFRGTLARSAVARVLEQADVRAVLLVPVGKDLPAEEVRVELRLVGGLPNRQQRDLHAQARQALAAAGFGEAIGYDTRRYTRVLGRIASGKLNPLLEDLRRQPAAWPLLPGSFLADLRKQPNGSVVLERVVTEWRKLPGGEKLVRDLVEQWQVYPAALEFFRTLRIEAKQDPTVLIESQIHNFVTDPGSAELLGKLFDEVRKSEAGPAMMDILLARIEASGLVSDLPVLFRASPPVRIVEAQVNWPLPGVPSAPPEAPKGQEKFSPDFRALVGDADAAMKPRRFEVLLRNPLTERGRQWAARYLSLPVSIEGRLGSIVTVYGPPSAAAAVAALPEVMAIRLPRRATEARRPARELLGSCAGGTPPADQYAQAGRLRQVVVIGADFRGWEALKGQGLPATTRLLDLTSERTRDFLPDPYPGDPKETGPGTQAALALVRSAATTELLLVRVDPEAPYQVDFVARLTAGEPEESLALVARLRDINDDRRELQARKDRLLEERQRLLLDFRPEVEKARQEHAQRQAEFERDRLAFEGRRTRFLAHERLTNDLRKMRVVWNTLTWDTGYPLFGTGPLSRFLDDHPYPGVWLQSRGGDLRRIWFGMFQDLDSSGSMEMLPATEPLPAGRWSPDFGFLAWKDARGQRGLDLPAGAVLRVAIQWQEIHDADLALVGDYFQEPLARLDVQVLHQLDPKGETRPADDLALIAQTVGIPQRILNTARYSVYEQAVEFRVEKAGRYLLRVPGFAPESTRPRELPTIPAAREVGELHPRVVVRTITGPGEALFEAPPKSRPALPMPADARRAVPLVEPE